MSLVIQTAGMPSRYPMFLSQTEQDRTILKALDSQRSFQLARTLRVHITIVFAKWNAKKVLLSYTNHSSPTDLDFLKHINLAAMNK